MEWCGGRIERRKERRGVVVCGGEGEGSGVYLLQKPNPGIFYRIPHPSHLPSFQILPYPKSLLTRLSMSLSRGTLCPHYFFFFYLAFKKKSPRVVENAPRWEERVMDMRAVGGGGVGSRYLPIFITLNAHQTLPLTPFSDLLLSARPLQIRLRRSGCFLSK